MAFAPTISLKNVLQIDEQLLLEHEIKALLLDLDNTLSLHGSPMAENGVFDWLDRMNSLGIKMIIISNNTNKRVKPLAKELGLEYVANGWKPFTFGITKGLKRLGVDKRYAAMVGDQLFTDILGGNLKGVKTILVEPFHIEKGWLFVAKRGLERLVFKRDYSKIKKK